MDEALRKQIRLLKALNGLSYKEIAQRLEMNIKSFYCWMYGKYNLATDKANIVQQKLLELKENL